METPKAQPATKCRRCGDELPGGVRFCVACGTNNFDPDAAALATANLDIKAHGKRAFWKRFIYWYRYFMCDIRR